MHSQHTVVVSSLHTRHSRAYELSETLDNVPGSGTLPSLYRSATVPTADTKSSDTVPIISSVRSDLSCFSHAEPV